MFADAFFSETTKLYMDDHWKVLQNVCVSQVDQQTKMTTIPGYSLLEDAIGKWKKFPLPRKCCLLKPKTT